MPRLPATPPEPLGVLLLPAKLEEFELRRHAGDLLSIPRVVAVEPGRLRRRRLVGEAQALRQARRLRLPGRAALLVLYHPRQYPLARALAARHQAELWYVDQAEPADPELAEFARLARERATATISAEPGADPRTQNEPLRRRLVELEVISSRPFVPGARLLGR